MLAVGTDDGVYLLDGVLEPGKAVQKQTLESGAVMRLERFEAIGGLFAATESGLYHSPTGTEWADLGVPEEMVYAVAAANDGSRLYAGTRPAHLYVADIGRNSVPSGPLEWRELEAFQRLPSRPSWRTPRHEDTAQVRDIEAPENSGETVVAAVEVGGVHQSSDCGASWAERCGAVHSDVHELHAVDSQEYLAATGFGVFRTTDGGHSWDRLDEAVDQEYAKALVEHDGRIYTSATHGPPSTWAEADSGPTLLESVDGNPLEAVPSPCPDEVVIGWTVHTDQVIGTTHEGHLLARSETGWELAGEYPAPDEENQQYAPLSGFDPSITSW